MTRQETGADPAKKIVVKREGGVLAVRVPVKFYRRNGRQRTLSEASASAQSRASSRPSRTLVEHLAKAYRWQEQLESGDYSSFDQLGKAMGVNRTCVGRILPLASLSSPLVEDSQW